MSEPSYPLAEEKSTSDKMQKLSFKRCGCLYHTPVGNTEAKSLPTADRVDACALPTPTLVPMSFDGSRSTWPLSPDLVAIDRHLHGSGRFTRYYCV